MIKSSIDHLVITASSRSAGSKFLAGLLGVELVEGGEHPRMGTHNALVRIGKSVYLEVIAVNPDAPKPTRPRWFGLDELSEDAAPRLATWVVRTTDIQRALEISNLPVGQVERMSRRSFEWQITVPEGGALPLTGAAPALIQWNATTHPTDNLPESGCELLGLRVRHPDAELIETALGNIGFEGPVEFAITQTGESPALAAIIQTPLGIIEL